MPVSNQQRVTASTLTPVQRVGSYWLKRDDLWQGAAPARGGKARTAEMLCLRAKARGVTEFHSTHDRNSSVPGMLARVCRHHGIGLHIWYPDAATPMAEPFLEAWRCGAIPHAIRPGYMSVRKKRMRDHVENTNSVAIYGDKAVVLDVGLRWEDCGRVETAAQAANVLDLIKRGEAKRVVVPVGSGGMLLGISDGLPGIPILGVCCGGFPDVELPGNVELVKSSVEFAREVRAAICHDGSWHFVPDTWENPCEGDVDLDPVYEAKCVEFLEEGDLLWIVAHRETE